ncbi:aminoglycoside N(3)-acetyltransferase [Amycolatopsis sp. Poz14]|uniref:aminoglycoside N(3)-acetyltransferase n=1 Tax=Amycolatopsis sp. Poz14 TaxID=1447705 RepID=UPI001EE7F72B|nr:AAC(3) family N-acetyltransferase [Amycolatopsis sp. Poz14]MCG3757178.1 AAC(3) family N-acetyltransferase [Amycolatopsis sp. Poz14]
MAVVVVVDADVVCAGVRELGVSFGGVVMVHSSLSALGEVDGGADAVVRGVLRAVGPEGTVVVPAFTPQVADPFPEYVGAGDVEVDEARGRVPLFHEGLATPMGAIPNAVLGWEGSCRSRHPQASVAAVGARAAEVAGRQPLAYAVGRGSPFEWLYRERARILLLGVGHDRNSFLHYAESLVPHHRRKVRRFPYLVEGERVWVRTDDVGDDNGRFFPQVGAEFEATGGVRRGKIGSAECQVMDCVPFVGFARRRLAELLR